MRRNIQNQLTFAISTPKLGEEKSARTLEKQKIPEIQDFRFQQMDQVALRTTFIYRIDSYYIRHYLCFPRFNRFPRGFLDCCRLYINSMMCSNHVLQHISSREIHIHQQNSNIPAIVVSTNHVGGCTLFISQENQTQAVWRWPPQRQR